MVLANWQNIIIAYRHEKKKKDNFLEDLEEYFNINVMWLFITTTTSFIVMYLIIYIQFCAKLLGRFE